jgi:hypothetical protein
MLFSLAWFPHPCRPPGQARLYQPAVPGVKKLERRGVLRRYVGLVDLERIGKGILGFVFLTSNA